MRHHCVNTVNYLIVDLVSSRIQPCRSESSCNLGGGEGIPPIYIHYPFITMIKKFHEHVILKLDRMKEKIYFGHWVSFMSNLALYPRHYSAKSMRRFDNMQPNWITLTRTQSTDIVALILIELGFSKYKMCA